MHTRGLSIPYIAWEIQLTCNMGCQFCYSSSYNQYRRSESQERLDLEKIHSGLQLLHEADIGIKHINWSGGEPLLRFRDLPRIFQSANEQGFGSILSTNGMFSVIFNSVSRNHGSTALEQFTAYLKNDINGLLDWLSVSFDSADANTNNNIMRLRPDGLAGSPYHYDDILSLLELYRSGEFHFQLKVNTLVTRKNIGDGILEIGEHLKGLNCEWKLVQFNPRECTQASRKDYEISQQDFLAIRNAAIGRYAGKPGYGRLKILDRAYDGTSEPYCFLVVNTSGQVLLPKGEEHVRISSLYGANGTVTAPEKLRDEITKGIMEHLRETDTYKNYSNEGRLSPLEVFSLRNRAIHDRSYPTLPFSQKRICSKHNAC